MKNSIAKRMGRTLAIAMGVLVIIILSLCFLQAKWRMEDQIESRVHGALDNANGMMEKMLTECKVSTDDFAWSVEQAYRQNSSNPNLFYDLTRMFVEGHPNIDAVAIGFRPEAFSSQGRWFSPFTYRSADSLATVQLGNKNYEYHYMAWYQIPEMTGKPQWIDPYVGRDDRYVTSYSVPIYDASGKFLAVVECDIRLDALTARFDSLSIMPGAKNFMIASDGRFIVTTDPRFDGHTVYTAISLIPDSLSLVQGARDVQAGNSGMVTYKMGREKKRGYYAPMATTGWATATLCSEKDIFYSTAKFFQIMLLLTLLAVGLVAVLAYLIAKRFLKPLGQFATAAGEISKGDFAVDLPDSSHDDEVHQLHDAFDNMQLGLEKYMDEVKTVTASKERVEGELQIAHEIQMGMVPKIFPPYPDRKDIDIYATLTPAKEVGGDLYDFFIANEKLYFVIGDVSGKGVPASLVMAVARSMFRTLASNQEDPSKILTQMNDAMSDGNSSDMFVTIFGGVLDLKTGHVDYCNGGHNAPMIVGPKQGDAYYLDVVPNLPIGTIGGMPFQKQSIDIKPGTTIFMYTDGLTEAENEAKELYGEERLEALMKHEGLLTPREMVDDVMNSVHAHVRDAEQSDDLTILAVKYI